MKALLSGLAVLAAVALPALAQEAEPDDAIKFRQNVMKGIGGSAGNIGAILQGKVAQQDKLEHLAQMLAMAADPTLTTAAFKQNTDEQGFERTSALGKIWEDWDDFESRLQKLGEATKAAADAGSGVSMDEMKAVFEVCKGCHDTYREKS